MANSCTTISNGISRVLCDAAHPSPFTFSAIPAYASLPPCAQSVVSYNIIDYPFCVAEANFVPAGASTTPYPICVCTDQYNAISSFIGQEVTSQCTFFNAEVGGTEGGQVVPGAWTPVLESYCDVVAGGFVVASATSSASSVERTSSGGVSATSTFVQRTSAQRSAASTGITQRVTITRIVTATSSSTPSSGVVYGTGVGNGSNLSGGATIGIVIGAIVAAILLALLAFCLVRRRNRKDATGEKSEDARGTAVPESTGSQDEADVQGVPPNPEYGLHRFFMRFNMQQYLGQNARS